MIVYKQTVGEVRTEGWKREREREREREKKTGREGEREISEITINS